MSNEKKFQYTEPKSEYVGSSRNYLDSYVEDNSSAMEPNTDTSYNSSSDAITQHHLKNLREGTYVKNKDGSISTVSTMQVDINGVPTLIPSIWNGKHIDDPAEAAKLAKESGIKWPTAKTHEELRKIDIEIHKPFDKDIDKYIKDNNSSNKEANNTELVGRLEYNQPESKGRWIGSKTQKLFAMIGEKTPTQQDGDYSSFKSKLEDVESGGDYNAYNKGSGAYGKYQFIPSTLKEYAKKTGQTIEQAKTPEGQDKMFERFTKDNKNALKKMGIEPTELNLWIAHNQGRGGAAAILKAGKLTPRLKRNISANLPSGIEPTIDNYLKYWSTKFNG